VQARRPDDVRGMEFLQGVGSKTGAMPLSNDIMYLFHIRPEAPDAISPDRSRPVVQTAFGAVWRLRRRNRRIAQQRFRHRLQPDRAADAAVAVVSWTGRHWRRRRAHLRTASHAGAAMAAEDAFVLAREVLDDDVPIEARLMRYSMKRYPRCAFVYTFSGQWLHDEQSVRSAEDLEAARAE